MPLFPLSPTLQATKAIEYINHLVASQDLRLLDIYLVKHVHNEYPLLDDTLLIALAFCSYQSHRRRTFLPLAEFTPEHLPHFNVFYPEETTISWLERLAFHLKQQPKTWLVHFADKLYLYRYYESEKAVANNLLMRTQITMEIPLLPSKSAFNAFFPKHDHLDYQQVAAVISATRKFSIISGGPGTGKTTTITKILALLITSYWRTHHRAPRIRLVAPTGKAAARLTESIQANLKHLTLEENYKYAFPTQATTIHRLLREFAQDQRRSLKKQTQFHIDILVIDEVSMVDLTLMQRLLQHCPIECHLIMMGDKDQLPSVDAGNLLHDISSIVLRNQKLDYSSKTRSILKDFGLNYEDRQAEPDSPLNDHFVILRKSYRFDEKSQIGLLAHAIQTRTFSAQDWLWNHGLENEVNLFHLQSLEKLALFRRYQQNCLEFVREAQALSYHQEHTGLFTRLREHQMLCATRFGAMGVESINQKIESYLAYHHLKSKNQTHYVGKPIIILKNSHHLKLYNGDVGILLFEPMSQQICAGFQQVDGNIRYVPYYQLPEHETVFAMTIHKSQGSEFDQVYMMVDSAQETKEHESFLTRELIYTGVTRSKRRLYIAIEPQVLEKAIHLSYPATTGLAEHLRS
ncbi:MAG: exodeoxyribonuclease V subunit alpha [Pseudomonadota bacterium]